ncbi:hypothetical protein P3S68_027295 [Capsicum galapagoense]
MAMRSDESYLHVSDSESTIRRDMRKEEHASTKAMAEKSGRLHIPPKGKQENFQKSNHPNYRYDLPEKNSVRDAFDVKMDKAIHESENTRILDDSSASREEIMEDLKVKDDPHESQSMSSSYDSSISKDVSPFGATLNGTSKRESIEDVHTMNPPPHDSIFLEDVEIQLKKLDYDPFDSQNYLKNIQMKGQGNTSEKSTVEKLDQREDITTSSSGSGILMTINNEGREKVGNDHNLNIEVGSATGNFSKLNDSNQSDDISRKLYFKNKIKSEEQNNEFSHNFIQANTDGNFQQSNWHNQPETHSARVQVKDITSPISDSELEE